MNESWTYELQETVRPEMYLREMDKPNYKTIWSFRFDPNARYFRLEKESKTDTGYVRDGKGMVELKRNANGEYVVRYLKFGALKKWGQEGWYASRKPVPVEFQSLIAEKRADLTMDAQIDGVMNEHREQEFEKQQLLMNQELHQQVDTDMKVKMREQFKKLYLEIDQNPSSSNDVHSLYKQIYEQMIETKRD